MSSDFYRALEERFRAPREEIRRRLEGYLPYLRILSEQSVQPRAFDIGCGRGEWLQLLTEEGFQAQGVDLDDSMLAACHERGLHAENQDALQALSGMADASLDLVSAFHVVEHLDFDYLHRLLTECRRVLRHGGLLILETPNSENLIVGTSNFYLDPTHQRPVPALFLQFLCEYHRFDRCRILRLQEDPVLHQADAHIGLWQVLYGVSPDYALVAQKGPVEVDDAMGRLLDEQRGLTLEELAYRHDRTVQGRSEQLDELEQVIRVQGERLARLDEQAARDRVLIDRLVARVDGSVAARLARLFGRVGRPQVSWRWFKHAVATLASRPVLRLAAQFERQPVLAGLTQRLRLAWPRLGRRFDHYMAVLRLIAGSPAPVASSPRTLLLAERLERLVTSGEDCVPAPPQLRVAYVSPLPPERTGIADYSAELLPALAEHYQIDVVVQQPELTDEGIKAGYTIRDGEWLLRHADAYHAVVYHVGNSHYHAWMHKLIRQVPGVVVLHDFYLSGLIWALDAQPEYAGIKWQELHYGSGHAAVVDVVRGQDEGRAALAYPFNRSLLEAASGVIVHSDVSLRLARQWYGPDTAKDWALIPHLRQAVDPEPRQAARARLGIAQNGFVVCSFGLLGLTKLNDRLLSAWLASCLAAEPDGLLVFVGELGDDAYAVKLRRAIEQSGCSEQIRITGWAEGEIFRGYLAAADLAVQLRTMSRGETSGTVLDCMNYALPTIINANGSMADLPAEGVWRLPDEFTDGQLIDALQTLRMDSSARAALGARARQIIETQHSPARCAARYAEAIETFAERAGSERRRLQSALKPLGSSPAPAALRRLAAQLEPSLPSVRQPQLLVDITATCQQDRQTGIERVARALTVSLLENPPPGYRVEPVYLCNSEQGWHYRYACQYTARMLGLSAEAADYAIDVRAGDRLIALDISGDAFVAATRAGLYERLHATGVATRMLVHDLLPVTRPELFPARAQGHFHAWLQAVTRLQGAVCVTQTVASELRHWLAMEARWRRDQFQIAYSHHGADLSSSAPSRGLPAEAEAVLERLAAAPSILMVGTLEPRKGYLQALAAFDQLWASGAEVNLVIVGREGWRELPDAERRDIPAVVQALRTHGQSGHRLFWLEGISDEYLERVYASCKGLLAASEDEGFGLPLIEAAQHGLSILARDIPVFREVAGEHARFFRAGEPSALARALRDWIGDGFTPTSRQLPWLTWQQSAGNLVRILTELAR